MEAKSQNQQIVFKGITINAPVERVFDYLAEPSNLPEWTNAFKEADPQKARMVTPQGELLIGLKTVSNKAAGTIDWHMTMPDQTTTVAYSRLVKADDNISSIYHMLSTCDIMH